MPAETRLTSADQDDEDESYSGWLSNLFKRKKGDEPRKSEQFELVLAAQPGYVDFTLLDSRGMEATTALASQVRAALARALE